MPLPAIAGVGWLGSLIATFFGAVLAWFGKFLTKRLAIAAALVSAIAGLTTAFWLAIVAILEGISAVGPPFMSQAAGLVVPSNLPACFAAILSAHVVRWIYHNQVKVLLYTNPGAGI